MELSTRHFTKYRPTPIENFKEAPANAMDIQEMMFGEK
jgi:hypothetical protein